MQKDSREVLFFEEFFSKINKFKMGENLYFLIFLMICDLHKIFWVVLLVEI